MSSECGGKIEPTSDCGNSSPKKSRQELELDSPLCDKADMSLAELRGTLRDAPGDQAVRSYPMSSVKLRDGQLVQTGSGPNIEGGLLTLCTCKHQMRASDELKEGSWIAGFGSSTLREDRHNPLFYLARVEKLFESQAELWNYLGKETREAKSAENNPLGDVFRPLPDRDGDFGPENYATPVENHSHRGSEGDENEGWHEDVSKRDKQPDGAHKLVVADPAFTFIYRRPIVLRAVSHHSRNFEKHTLSEFLNDELIANE